MPIRKELRHFYRTPEWKAARAACRERAGDRCEQCGAPNKKTVLRAFRYWTPYTFEATLFFLRATRDGKEVTELPWHHRDTVRIAHFPWHDGMKVVWIQCGAAHLNNVAGDDRLDNLAWLCRGCHLDQDMPFHRLTRATRKDSSRPILEHLASIAQRASATCAAEGRPDTPQLQSLKKYLEKGASGCQPN